MLIVDESYGLVEVFLLQGFGGALDAFAYGHGAGHGGESFAELDDFEAKLYGKSDIDLEGGLLVAVGCAGVEGEERHVGEASCGEGVLDEGEVVCGAALTAGLCYANDIFIAVVAMSHHEFDDVADDECCGVAYFVVTVFEACCYGVLVGLGEILEAEAEAAEHGWEEG